MEPVTVRAAPQNVSFILSTLRRCLAGIHRRNNALALSLIKILAADLEVHPLLTHHMRDVPFAFRADVFEQIRVEHDGLIHLDRPWLGVCFGIVDGHFDFQLPEVRPPEPFSHFGGAGQRRAVVVGPQALPEASCLHHQSVPVPLSRRVTKPRWLCIAEHGPSVGEDLPEPFTLMENGDESGHLNDPPGKRNGVHLQDAYRQTSHAGTVFAMFRLARLPDLRRPRLIRQSSLESRVNVPELGRALRDSPKAIAGASRLDHPDSREIRLAIGRPRSRRGKVGLAVRKARNSSGWVIQPLRVGRPGHRERHHPHHVTTIHYTPPLTYRPVAPERSPRLYGNSRALSSWIPTAGSRQLDLDSWPSDGSRQGIADRRVMQMSTNGRLPTVYHRWFSRLVEANRP